MKNLLFVAAMSGLFAQNAFQVQVTGKGHPIILVPGLAASGATWESVVERYQDRFECHVLTLAGFAGVPRVAPSTSGMLAGVREEIAGYIRAKKLDRPILVGHSLGGFLVLDLASHYPDLAAKIVIVDAYPFTMGLDPKMTPSQAKAIAGQIRAGMTAMSAEAYVASADTGASTNSMASSEADRKRLIEWARTSHHLSVADALSEMLGADLREDIAKIGVPAMVLAAWRGSESVGASHDAVDRNMHAQYAKLKGVEIQVSDNARHFIMWDDPQWMFRHLDRFLTAK